jgi:hypothetical protein
MNRNPEEFMKKTMLWAAAAAGLLLGATSVTGAEPGTSRPRGDLVHMVSFKFKETSSPADIRKVEEAFAALPKKIPQIVSYEWGTNVSPEKHDKGFTHGFILTFRTAKDRDVYLEHPDHKAFGAIVGPHLADVFVIDFWASSSAKPAQAQESAR